MNQLAAWKKYFQLINKEVRDPSDPHNPIISDYWDNWGPGTRNFRTRALQPLKFIEDLNPSYHPHSYGIAAIERPYHWDPFRHGIIKESTSSRWWDDFDIQQSLPQIERFPILESILDNISPSAIISNPHYRQSVLSRSTPTPQLISQLLREARDLADREIDRVMANPTSPEFDELFKNHPSYVRSINREGRNNDNYWDYENAWEDVNSQVGLTETLKPFESMRRALIEPDFIPPIEVVSPSFSALENNLKYLRDKALLNRLLGESRYQVELDSSVLPSWPNPNYDVELD